MLYIIYIIICVCFNILFVVPSVICLNVYNLTLCFVKDFISTIVLQRMSTNPSRLVEKFIY